MIDENSFLNVLFIKKKYIYIYCVERERGRNAEI